MPDRRCLYCHGIGYLSGYDTHGRPTAARCRCNPEPVEPPKPAKKPKPAPKQRRIWNEREPNE